MRTAQALGHGAHSSSALSQPVRRPQRYLRPRHRQRVIAAAESAPPWKTIEDYVGQTPLVKLQRLGQGLNNNTILCKLEGNNPAGSVKDRPALSLVSEAEKAGVIKPGDVLIEATSGNTGIALAMAAAIKGYRMKLIMPRSASAERGASMSAYGAELIYVDGGMEDARDLAMSMQARGEGRVLDQFGNPDNPLAHLRTTGPELWEQTGGRITHFVASMGTTGTIMGTSAYLKLMSPDVQIVGLQPKSGAQIPGIRRWPPEYLPSIFQSWRVDKVMDISQREAEQTMRVLARTEGIFAGVSSGGAVSAALRLSAEVSDAVICVIICDRGDRYLSTGVYGAEASAQDPQSCTPDEFWSSVQCLVRGFPGPHWVLFVGQESGDTQGPWCSDSHGVEAAVRGAMSAGQKRAGDSGGTLLVVHVGSQEAWSDPAHPLRVDPRIQLRMLPTIMLWRDSPTGATATRRFSGDIVSLIAFMQRTNEQLAAEQRTTPQAPVSSTPTLTPATTPERPAVIKDAAQAHTAKDAEQAHTASSSPAVESHVASGTDGPSTSRPSSKGVAQHEQGVEGVAGPTQDEITAALVAGSVASLVGGQMSGSSQAGSGSGARTGERSSSDHAART